MKKIIALIAPIIAMVSCAGAAYAHNQEDEHSGPSPQTQSQGQEQRQSADASSRSTSQSSADSSSKADSHSSVDSSNTASVSNTYKQVRQIAPAAIAAGNATAACQKDRRAGVSVLGAGVSVGGSRTDVDCQRLALAEFLYSRGNTLAGDRVMCAITEIKRALGDDCLAYINQQPAAANVGAVQGLYTETQKERDARIAEKLTSK